MTKNEKVARSFEQYFAKKESELETYNFNITTLSYKRKRNDFLELIDLYFEEDRINSGIIFSGIGAYLRINPVEKILQPLLAKYLAHLFNVHLSAYFYTVTFTKVTGNQQAVWESLRPYATINLQNNPSAIASLAEVVHEQIQRYIEPFWQQYSDLQFINDEIIQKVEQMQLHKYLGGMTAYKKLIIMKLCSNPNYTSYRDWLVDINESDYRIDAEKWGNEYNMVKELVSVLEQF